MKLFFFLVKIFIFSLFLTSSIVESSDKPKEKVKGTHWSRIGKRIEYNRFKDRMKGKNRIIL